MSTAAISPTPFRPSLFGRANGGPSPAQGVRAQGAAPARRADLIVRIQDHEGQRRYIVKDPLTLRYYRFAPAEFQLFELLDGVKSLDEIHQQFCRDFTLRNTSENEVRALVMRWQQSGLLQDKGNTATTRVLAIREKVQSGKWLGRLTGILYFKVHAFDPDPLLNRIYPWVKVMFHPLGLVLAGCSMLAALLLVAARFEQFTSQPEIQDFHAFFNLQNIVWLWLSVGIVKILHEFGHGLTCKHFGGECHAMGLLFMCFTPCMYCDVSDSWLLTSKWHRIAIAAAGIYVELLVASLATFVWWWTVPGVLHSIAFAAMLYGSVQTILINANPLMRFDGYYVMSDYLEVPNLRQKSVAFTKYYLKSWFWDTAEGPPGSGGLAFVVYAVVASAYRILLTVGMVWFLSKILEPYKLQAVGWVLAAMAAINIAVLPMARGLTAAVRSPAAFRPRSWWRPMLAAGLVAALAWGFFSIPMPRRAYAVLTLEPRHSELVATSTRGRIVKQYASPGQIVHKGNPLIELDDPGLRQQAERMEQQRDKLRVEARVAIATLDPAQTQRIEVALKELDSQLAVLHQRIKDLVLCAPCDGRVIVEPERDSARQQSSSNFVPLGGWKRTVLHQENAGASLSVGTNICRIGSTDDCMAVAILSQTQVESVQQGQRAVIKLDAFPDQTILGTVQDISVQDVDQVAPQLLNIHGSELPAIPFGPNAGQLATTHYRIQIQLTELTHGQLKDYQDQLKTGLRGRVWIEVGSQTAAQATWRWICQVLQW